MSNHEMFIRPGEAALSFVLSLFNISPHSIDYSVLYMLILAISLFMWWQLLRVLWALFKRIFGLDRGRGR